MALYFVLMSTAVATGVEALAVAKPFSGLSAPILGRGLAQVPLDVTAEIDLIKEYGEEKAGASCARPSGIMMPCVWRMPMSRRLMTTFSASFGTIITVLSLSLFCFHSCAFDSFY